MRGPDFELPPIDPPPPPVVPPAPVPPKHRRFPKAGAAALAGLLGLSGIGAYAWYSASGSSSPPTRIDPPATGATAGTLPAGSSATTLTPTTRAVTRTCLESEETFGAAREGPPDRPPWLTLHFGPRVSTAALVLISEAASAARQAFGEAGAVGIHVHCTLEEYAASLNRSPEEALKIINEGRIASIHRSDITIYGPRFERQPSAERRRIVYHEYFHAVQHTLSRNRSARSDLERPMWLIEGSARFFENAVTQRELDAFRRDLRRWAALPELATLVEPAGSDSPGGNAAYTLGSVAADYLVKTYGRDRLQYEFWAALAATDWRSAFSQVFGVSVDSFYADFETYRATLRP